MSMQPHRGLDAVLVLCFTLAAACCTVPVVVLYIIIRGIIGGLS